MLFFFRRFCTGRLTSNVPYAVRFVMRNDCYYFIISSRIFLAASTFTIMFIIFSLM